MVKDSCCCHDCECDTKKEKLVKVSFCPKCGSKEVGFIFRFGNAFGVIPRMECKKCKFNGAIFPLLIVDQENLNKANRKVINKTKKKKGAKKK